MKRQIIILTLLTLVHPLFAQSKLSKKITSIPESNKTIDIPKYENGKPFVFYHFCKQKESQLNLSQPETSSDSLLIRIWLTVPTSKKNQRHDFIEIRRSNNTFSAQVINMSVAFKKSKVLETITNHMQTTVAPVSNWQTIMDSLFYWKIDALPTDQLLPDYAINSSNYSNRAPTFSFEYSTPSIYRFYQYNNVWKIQDKYWEALNVVNITNLLDQEFHVDSLANVFYDKYLSK